MNVYYCDHDESMLVHTTPKCPLCESKSEIKDLNMEITELRLEIEHVSALLDEKEN